MTAVRAARLLTNISAGGGSGASFDRGSLRGLRDPNVLRYSLQIKKKVKKMSQATVGPRSQTRVSSKHQITIPATAFRTAGLETGDTLKVEAAGAGRVVLTRIDKLVDRYSGCLDTGGHLRRQVEGLREEWR
ncbi:MAG: AbrB/MazE/SpoVT family DNA-binding domain-containing protein [Solirubrobacterales bacterium]